MTGQEILQTAFIQLEGPYKWYVLLFIAAIITGVLTRFVFKTIKWFLLIAALGVLLFYLWSQLFMQIDQGEPIPDLSEPGKKTIFSF